MSDSWLRSRLHEAIDEIRLEGQGVIAVGGKGAKARRKLQRALADLDALTFRHRIHDEDGAWEVLLGPRERGPDQFIEVGYIQPQNPKERRSS